MERQPHSERQPRLQDYAGVLIAWRSGLILQLRDDIPIIENPGKLTSFGGGVIASDRGSAQAAALREITEETNLSINLDALEVVTAYDYTWPSDNRQEQFFIFAAHLPDDFDVTQLQVYEGAGFEFVESADDPRLAECMLPAVRTWFARQQESS